MRKSVCICIIACIVFSLCGCGNWIDGSYYSVEPHLADNAQKDPSVAVASTYMQLRDALAQIVQSGRQNGVILIDEFAPQTVESFMNMAIDYAFKKTAIGAYALENVSYEVGMNAGKQAVAVNQTYSHSRSELLQIKHVHSMDEALNLILSNLNNCTAGIVLKVDAYADTDFVQMIEDHAHANPQTVMEIPQVSAAVYPESGDQRVIDISFTYQTSREDLRSMQQKVRPIFTAAELYVKETTLSREKFSQLYSFLMERYEQYTHQTSITPSYSLLMYGVGDSRAFADVYAAMCASAGLDCKVISGTKKGEPWNWNLISYDGVNYHVDLLRCAQSGGFAQYTQEQMTRYVWDYAAYTAQPEQ